MVLCSNIKEILGQSKVKCFPFLDGIYFVKNSSYLYVRMKGSADGANLNNRPKGIG